ncbi:MAG: HEAT repeat domain-containing protein [Planctomyces sp.]|nr:HEAT repeat domain-containing protein [Planctomyces sp.]
MSRAVAALGVLILVFAAVAQAEDEHLGIAGPSDAAELALKGFRLAPGVSGALVAAEPELANPVAFCFDEQGRIYVAETFRQDRGVTDNRGHMNWLEDDLSLETVEQRGEMFRRYLGPEVDGWSRYPDRIRRLSDENGDGRYETATVFATGFNDLLDGTGSGVLARRGDVYYTCIPKLWKLRDETGDGVANVREPLHHGYGVRVAFRGHDMHGLIWGPDGRLYYSIGDRGYNVETREGTRLARPDTGAVFRCEPDGSNLEVYAYGLRNPQELAFNDEGDLFTGDNNSDGGDRARWVYVAPGGDSGWRMYYQYPQDRGPWNREKMWSPYRENDEVAAVQPAYIVPPILNIADGPSGLTFDPGVGLPEEHRGRFFLVDFRGSPGNSGVRSFRVRQQGAGFELTDSDWFLRSMLATDFDFGPDGALYALDWVDGWTGEGKGRIYRFDVEGRAPAGPTLAELYAAGFESFADDRLLDLLGHPDRRVRLESQFELAERTERRIAGNDEALLTTLATLARTSDRPLQARHALWGYGQSARRTGRRAGRFDELLQTDDAEQRRQALRVATDLPRGAFDGAEGWSADVLASALTDAEPRVRFQAALALGRHGSADHIPALLEVLAVNRDEDPFLRHAAATALAGIGDAEALLAAADNPSASARLGIVIALRRLEHPGLARFLTDGDSRVVQEAGRAIHDLGLAEALPALAAQIHRPGFSQLAATPAGAEFARRVINANNRLGGEPQARAIAAAAADSGLPDALRALAARSLLDWSSPPRLDAVTGEFRPIPERSREEAEQAVRGGLPSLLAGSARLREAGVRLAAAYGIRDVGPVLQDIVRSNDSGGAVRVQALSALDELKDDSLRGLVDELLSDREPVVRAEARRLLAKFAPERALPLLEQAAIAAEAETLERQSAVRGMSALGTSEADAALERLLVKWAEQGQIDPAIQLELLEAAESSGSDRLRGLLDRILAARGTDPPTAAWTESLEGGDAERGRSVFFGSAAASCRRCHKINGEGSDVGPDLSEIGRLKSREYLLESIVDPNAKIAEGFETAVFALDDGRVVSGVVRFEDDRSFRVITPQGEVEIVDKSQIEDRAKGQSGMPADIVRQISRRELRDLVEFLSTLQVRQEPEGHRQ